MTRYILRRTLWTLPVLLVGTTLAFLVLRLIPGDPVNLMLAARPASEQMRENLRRKLGLDRPLLQQYVHFVSRAAQGDFGDSFRTLNPVTSQIKEHFPATLQLAVGGLLVGVIGGLTLGVTAGLRPNSPMDSGIMFLALVGVSMPVYWLSMLLIFVFGLRLGWVPIVGEGWEALILPSFAVGAWAVGEIARLVRSAILDVRGEDYVRTAYAKGLPNSTVVLRHALRNALIPVVTIVGLQLGVFVSGGVIVETIFARQGIGTLLIGAIFEKDYPMVQAVIVITTGAYVLANFGVDLAYAVLDPRIRYA